MRKGDTVWIDLADKQRPGIVIEVGLRLVRIAYGTSQDHGPPRLVMLPNTRQGRAFPLTLLTHFYGANTCWELPMPWREVDEVVDCRTCLVKNTE